MYIDALEKFSQIDFETDLKVELDNFDINLNDYDIFEHVLDKHAPKKSKLIRGNEKPHMTGELKKAIMRRSNLWNKFQKTKCSSDLHAYKTQRNLVTNLNNLAKQKLFNNAINLSGDKPKAFWNLCKPFFSNKGVTESEIVVKKDGKLVQGVSSLVETFNEHYNTRAIDKFKSSKYHQNSKFYHGWSKV